MDGSAVLSVGDSINLGLFKGRVIYAGMPSPDVYSMVHKKYEFMYQGYAWNLFYPREQSRIRVEGVNILVESVTPAEIRLRVSST